MRIYKVNNNTGHKIQFTNLNVLDIVDSVVGHDRGSGGEVLGVVSGPVSGQTVVVLNI